MKKTFYTLLAGLAFSIVLLSSCKKFNDQFDGLDAKTLPTNVAAYSYTLVDADYITIATAANKTANDSITLLTNQAKTASHADSVIIVANIARIKADSAYIKAVYVGANKFFNSKMQAKDYVPYLLNMNYLFADKGSLMNATYNIVDMGDTSAIPLASKFTLTSDDYFLMGNAVNQPGQYNNMSAVMPVLRYLDKFLKLKCPYAMAGDIKMVVYQYYDTKTTKRQYRVLTFDGLNWQAAAEQYNFVGTNWLYDPTVKLTMVKSDYQLMVDYVLATPAIAIFGNPFYKNEEYYWGFISRYSNISFRLSYRSPYYKGYEYEQPATIDPELNALTTTEAKVALMWDRLKGGMEKFAQLRFPAAVPNVSGIDMFYKVKALIYYPTGIGGANEIHEYTFQCMAPASGGNPPTFKFISEKKTN
jgi:hypothetical protein